MNNELAIKTLQTIVDILEDEESIYRTGTNEEALRSVDIMINDIVFRARRAIEWRNASPTKPSKQSYRFKTRHDKDRTSWDDMPGRIFIVDDPTELAKEFLQEYPSIVEVRWNYEGIGGGYYLTREAKQK